MTEQTAKKVLFVRSGGGFPGIDVHLGLWLALEDAGIRSTHVSGTSAGAAISLLDACGLTASLMTMIIEQIDNSDIRAERFAWKLRVPWINWFMRPEPIEELLSELTIYCPVPAKPISVWATELLTGACRDVLNSQFGDAQIQNSAELYDDVSPVFAVMASMAISGVFPPRRFYKDGKTFDFVDGGVRKNLPLPSNWRDYDEVWLLIATPNKFDTYQKKTGILTRLIRNIELLMYDQIADVLEETSGSPKVHVLWPPCETPHGMFRFDHALINSTREWSARKIKEILNQSAKESV